MDSEKYIGLDVHQATISVAVIDSTGKLVILPHSIALLVNKPDERAGRFLAPLLEVVAFSHAVGSAAPGHPAMVAQRRPGMPGIQRRKPAASAQNRRQLV